jgi:hypothetical protein
MEITCGRDSLWLSPAQFAGLNSAAVAWPSVSREGSCAWWHTMCEVMWEVMWEVPSGSWV